MPSKSDWSELELGESTLPCAEKIAFDALRQAMAAANVAEYQHGAHVKPYQCQYCGLWHLASA